jgi:large subunit ribosomal protein L19
MAKIPNIKQGDLIKVYTKIVEGDKERLTPFQGIVIQTRGSDLSKTLTVRKVSAGVGIERIFPLSSPMIAKIEMKKRGKVRKAKLTYLKCHRGRRIKIKETASKTKRTTKKAAEKSSVAKEKVEGQTLEGTSGPQTVEKV